MKSSLALALTLASLIAVPAALRAAGPARQDLTINETIAAPPERVWAVIADFQDMGWHPAITNTAGRGGNAPRAVRTLTLTGGGQIVEELQTYDAAAHTFSYRILEVDPKVLPVTEYSSSLAVAPAADGGSIVTWKGSFDRGDPHENPPAGLTDEAAVDAVTKVYEAGLTNLKSLAEKKVQ